MLSYYNKNKHSFLLRNLRIGLRLYCTKEKFAESFGSEWIEARSDFDFIQDDVVEVLDEIGFMSIEAGRNWCEKATGDYKYKVEDFAALVRKYLERKGHNHHIVLIL